jgi:hypothetical protein
MILILQGMQLERTRMRRTRMVRAMMVERILVERVENLMQRHSIRCLYLRGGSIRD